jgi:hypothetical protein
MSELGFRGEAAFSACFDFEFVSRSTLLSDLTVASSTLVEANKAFGPSRVAVYVASQLPDVLRSCVSPLRRYNVLEINIS